jgi:uncharacterized membrane protein YfhO
MTTPTRTFDSTRKLRIACLAVLFLSTAGLLYYGLRQDEHLDAPAQQVVFPLVAALLFASLAVAWLWMQTAAGHPPRSARFKRWCYPVISGVLGLTCMVLAYAYLGVWPIGERTVMTVDMHHQFAPLLAQLRTMLLNGGDALYSFKIGLGANFLPLFGYYLASPFNLLLTLFPEHLLTEGIVVITLLKNALSAAFFAACVQYVYQKRSPIIPGVAILYSLMMYLMAYSWCIMWLDVVMVLPLAILLLERMLRTGKFLGYTLVLAYALFANYYIAFMLCVFLVLYVVVWAVRQPRRPGEIGRGLGRFAVSSLLGGGLVMALLVPVYIALGKTSAAGGKLPDIAANFPFFDLLGRHLFGVTPTIRSGNLPNVYCGLLPAVLLPLFATTKAIPRRRRVTYLALAAVMGLSMALNLPDLLWHGLHAPNDLPYRFSFLYGFVLILIGYETLLHLRQITPRQIAATAAGLAAFLILLERFGKDVSFETVYVSALFIAVYAGVIALVGAGKWPVRPAYAFLTLVITVEMVISASDALTTVHANEYFTSHDGYVDNETAETLRQTMARIKEIDGRDNGEQFYRMEFLPRRTTVDPALYDYEGFSVFASSNPVKTVKFMGSIGYDINGVNSYLYRSFVAPADALFGIKYVALDVKLASHPQLKLIDEVTVGATTRYIYENATALPMGYVVDPAVRQWIPTDYDPVTSLNDLYRRMTGIDEPLLTLHPITVDSGSVSVASTSEHAVNGERTSFSLSGKGTLSADFTVTLPDGGQTLIYVDCRAAESITVNQGSNSWSVNTSEPYFIDGGDLAAGDYVEVNVTAKSACIGNVFVATINEDVFTRAMERLNESTLQVTGMGGHTVEGTVNVRRAGVMMTAITYDDGWTVRIDGKEVEPVSSRMLAAADTGTTGMAEALLAFEVPAGEHTVELTYFPPGLKLGLTLSLLSLIALILLVRHDRKKAAAKTPPAPPAPAPEDAVPLSELSADDWQADRLFDPPADQPE